MHIRKDIIQGSDSWFEAKLGKMGASSASQLVSSTGKLSTSRKGLVYTLAAEILSGQREEGYTNSYMETGNTREAESRSLYELISGDTIEEVGIICPDDKELYLCSPDGICQKKKYGLELKNVKPKTMIEYLLKGTVPSCYVPQIQFSLMVTGFDYWVFMAYSPNLRPLILKVERDETLIGKLRVETLKAINEIDEIVKKLKEQK